MSNVYNKIILNISDKQVIILAPRFIESRWQEEMDNYGVKNPGRFTFISYKMIVLIFEKNIKGCETTIDASDILLKVEFVFVA